jgi:HAD superfamily hydrolase (TIGR01509 family)
MSKFSTVLFDMDGVLIDARDWHFQALNAALDPFGYSISIEDHFSRYNGLTTKAKLEILNNEFGFPKELNSIVNAVKQEQTLRIAAQMCYPSVQHQILISRLKKFTINVGVVTNSIKLTAEIMLEYAGLLKFLDVLVTNQDVSNPKPHSEPYILAMQKLNVDPSETLVIEDGSYGIVAAKNAGCVVQRVNSPDDVTIELIAQYIPSLLTENL